MRGSGSCVETAEMCFGLKIVEKNKPSGVIHFQPHETCLAWIHQVRVGNATGGFKPATPVHSGI